MIDQEIRSAIDAAFGEISAAWQASDAARLANAFAEDAVFVAFDGSRLLGREAICRFHIRPFATVLRGAGLLIELVDIRALSDTLCLVSTNGGPVLPGQAAIAETQTFIFRKSGSRWGIVSFHNTPILRRSGPRAA